MKPRTEGLRHGVGAVKELSTRSLKPCKPIRRCLGARTKLKVDFQHIPSRSRVTSCTATADPDTYLHSYDSDDDEAEHLEEAENFKTVDEDTGFERQELREGATLLERLHFGVLVAFHTLATAPQETWRAVKITAGAAAALVTQTAEDGVRDMVDERKQEEPPLSDRHETPVERARERWREAQNEMPEGTWGKIQWLWDQPPVKKLRITISMAQWSVRLPAIMALLATQMGLLASQVSLPMLAPLLLGTGMMLRSIRSNASIIFPRICVLVVLLYVLWFANSVVQSTVVYLRRQGALDARISGAVITASECCALLAALVIVLSMIGVNVSGLLLPAGIALAYAAKDLSHNFLAGFFLFAVQPFKLGDRISVSYSTPAAANSISRSAWFEGICEKVDLRYTIVKNGPRRLFVPNSAFLTREFVVVDDTDSPRSPSKRDLFHAEEPVALSQQQTPYGPTPASQRPVWAQQPQQYPAWPRPPHDAGMEQPEVGPSAEGVPPHWPGDLHRAPFGQPYGQRPADSERLNASPEQARSAVQENSNVLEWQRRLGGQRVSERDRELHRERSATGAGDRSIS